MANVAILIGNTEYQVLARLECCREDVLAIQELVQTTGKFESVELILNTRSSELKDRIRLAIDAHESIEEIFFYFTGHGFHHNDEFFFCATNFDPKRPNESGLSNSELHTLLRSPEPELVVKVVDACNSGSLLVKSQLPLSTNKQAFKHLIQIASRLNSQNSLTGDPLSLFTDRFRTAALRKCEGAVYYTDIIDALRDKFLDNDNQTPHFVHQGTGREQFVDDTRNFDTLRTRLSRGMDGAAVNAVSIPSLIQPTASAAQRLERVQKMFANKELADDLTSRLFEGIQERAVRDDSFSELFTTHVDIHGDFVEPTAHEFIVEVLAGEKRADNFVTARISYRSAERNLFGVPSISSFLDPTDKIHHLHLNCRLEKVQMKVTFTPKFVGLKRFVTRCQLCAESGNLLRHGVAYAAFASRLERVRLERRERCAALVQAQVDRAVRWDCGEHLGQAEE